MADGLLHRPSSSRVQVHHPTPSYAAILLGEKQIDTSSVDASSVPKSKLLVGASAPINCTDVEISDLKQPEFLQGTPAILFNQSEQSLLSRKFQYALVGKFSHGKPTWKKCIEFFDRIKLSGPCKVSIFDHKHLYIICSNKTDFNRLWLKLVWFVDGYAMRVFKWEPTFNVKKESSIAPVWIRMEGLPLYMFDKMPLLTISNVIGKPICIDSRNLNGSMCNSAKVCIELDVSKPLVKSIKLGIVQNGSKTIVEEHLVHVFYDVVPLYCQLCWHIGHSQASCKRCTSTHVDDDPLGGPIQRPGKEIAEASLASTSYVAAQGASLKDHQKITKVWKEVGGRQVVSSAKQVTRVHNDLHHEKNPVLDIVLANFDQGLIVTSNVGNTVVDKATENGLQYVGAAAKSNQIVGAFDVAVDGVPIDSSGCTVIEKAHNMSVQDVVDLEDGWTTVIRNKNKSISTVIDQHYYAQRKKAAHQLQHFQSQQTTKEVKESNIDAAAFQGQSERVDEAFVSAFNEDFPGRVEQEAADYSLNQFAALSLVLDQAHLIQAESFSGSYKQQNNSEMQMVVYNMDMQAVDSIVSNQEQVQGHSKAGKQPSTEASSLPNDAEAIQDVAPHIHERLLGYKINKIQGVVTRSQAKILNDHNKNKTDLTFKRPPDVIVAAPSKAQTSNYISKCNKKARNRFQTWSNRDYDSSDWTEADTDDGCNSEFEDMDSSSLSYSFEDAMSYKPSTRHSYRRKPVKVGYR